jgi:hypothetical protein
VTTAQRIRVNQLLLEREACFARVYECEQAVAQLLGEPYAWERPVLPSDQRAKRKPGVGKGGGAAREILRRLEPGEAKFRVTYQNLGREAVEEHEDVEALRGLLASQTARLQVLRVETVAADGATVATLIGEPAAT